MDKPLVILDKLKYFLILDLIKIIFDYSLEQKKYHIKNDCIAFNLYTNNQNGSYYQIKTLIDNISYNFKIRKIIYVKNSHVEVNCIAKLNNKYVYIVYTYTHNSEFNKNSEFYNNLKIKYIL